MRTKKANVKVVAEVKDRARADSWTLCFQKAIYHFQDGKEEEGYRFIYMDAKGHLRPQRGQARIEDARQLKRLIDKATSAGWLQ